MCTCARTCMCALTNTSIYIIILLKSVAVIKLQIAILARSSRETSQTVRNFFIREKHTKRGRNRVALACVYLNEAATAIVARGTGRHGWAPPTHRTPERHRGVCACTCVHACVRDVCAIHDNNI